MSAGSFDIVPYEDNQGAFWAVAVQPETLTFTLNTVVNVAGAGPVPSNFPSATVSGSRRRNGVFTRLVRFRFTGTLPPGYITNGILTIPVLTRAAWLSYSRTQTGTYSLEGTDYPVTYVGKSDEKIR